MEHIMKLNSSVFEKVKSGEKIREYRLYDEKRKLVRIGDTIKFLKLPELKEEVVVDVVGIEIFENWENAYSKYFDDDFKDRYKTLEDVVKDTYENYYSKKETEENGCCVFSIKKHRIAHLDATVCYLKKDNRVLMLKYTKKWGCVYAPPGGKFESGETPLDCVNREFFEETGLELVNPKLQGISYWKDEAEGNIFVFVADDFKGNLKSRCDEGTLGWYDMEEFFNLQQFEQNQKFLPYLFKDDFFEGKFLLDNKCGVLDYKITIF